MTRKEFEKWRKRARNKLPEISTRVFALREKFYTGCGFHWSLEKQLGYCIRSVSDFDTLPETADLYILPMQFADLFKQVVKIEKEIRL